MWQKMAKKCVSGISKYQRPFWNILEYFGTLEESDGSTQIGQFYLENGDTVIIEKHPAEKITCPTSKASAVGSPRG